jgi:hypothetical protein
MLTLQVRKLCIMAKLKSQCLEKVQNLSHVPYYPTRACAQQGYVIGRGVCMYACMHIYPQKFRSMAT